MASTSWGSAAITPAKSPEPSGTQNRSTMSPASVPVRRSQAWFQCVTRCSMSITKEGTGPYLPKGATGYGVLAAAPSAGALLATYSIVRVLGRSRQLGRILLLATGCAGLLIITLVFTLSFRLRQREFQTLADLGIAPRALLTVKLVEILSILLAAALLTGLTLPLAHAAAPHLVRLSLR